MSKKIVVLLFLLLPVFVKAKVSDEVYKTLCNQSLQETFSPDFIIEQSQDIEIGVVKKPELTLSEKDYFEFLMKNSRAVDVISLGLQQLIMDRFDLFNPLRVNAIIEPAYFMNRNQDLQHLLKNLGIAKSSRNLRIKNKDLHHFTWITELSFSNPYVFLVLAQHPAFIGFSDVDEDIRNLDFVNTTVRSTKRRLKNIDKFIYELSEEIERVERAVFNRYERELYIQKTKVYTFDGKSISYHQAIKELGVVPPSPEANVYERAKINELNQQKTALVSFRELVKETN
ncbi:MAG: hypothetical protein KDD58_13790 [Bdellovibrionales bacterium]|nr:hypothetical protein [Bdellovibrionales bacterium]